MNKNKIVVIQDCIMLPAIGWGYDYSGPVMHPTSLSDDVISKLLTSNPPVKFMYALNPKDYNKRVHITLDNYKLTNDELFEVESNVISEGTVSVDNMKANPNGVKFESDVVAPKNDTIIKEFKEANALESAKEKVVVENAEISDDSNNVEEGSDEPIITSNDAEFTESEIKDEVASNKIKFGGIKKKK